MAVYSYLRVSTDRQADDGQSLGAQQRQVEGYAMMQGFGTVTHFIERGVSGSIPLCDRPEGAKLLAGLGRGDIVITPKLDRCFRSARDALDILDTLKAQGVSLHMIDLGGDVTTNGVSKLVFTILSAVAENERERIRERIGFVKADQKARGRYLGGKVPFGFAVVDGALEPVQAQQDAIVTMKALKAAGKSLRAIADAMKSQGHEISHMAVKDILDRAA